MNQNIEGIKNPRIQSAQLIIQENADIRKRPEEPFNEDGMLNANPVQHFEIVRNKIMINYRQVDEKGNTDENYKR